MEGGVRRSCGGVRWRERQQQRACVSRAACSAQEHSGQTTARGAGTREKKKEERRKKKKDVRGALTSSRISSRRAAVPASASDEFDMRDPLRRGCGVGAPVGVGGGAPDEPCDGAAEPVGGVGRVSVMRFCLIGIERVLLALGV